LSSGPEARPLSGSHSLVAANGIELHLVEQGVGPPVILCHGFPELWFSWRHQLPALAAAGYRAVALDMRGYGRSSIPTEPESYDVITLCADLVCLLDVLAEEKAVFVGHDWGAAIIWEVARMHPEHVAAVVGLSVPFVPRMSTPPLDLLRATQGEDFVITWFQESDEADRVFASDVRRVLTSSELSRAKWCEPSTAGAPPPWLSEEELAFYVKEFERTGFTGGLNYYRCIDRNWKLIEPFADRRIEQPALFMVGSEDWIPSYMPVELMDEWIPDLRAKITIEGAGHWLQQECPREVNAAVLRFLGEIGFGSGETP
jgi:pimeloyl-ACP methyl ester carboxylesterase